MTIKIFLHFFIIFLVFLSIFSGLNPGSNTNIIILDIFIVFVMALIIRLSAIIFTIFLTKWRSSGPSGPSGSELISIIIPAYNEEQVIQSSLIHAFNLNYDNYEVILVDDGSTDKTLINAGEILYKNSRNIPIRIITQPNKGKASALNTGLSYTNGKYILCSDADSQLHPDSLKHGVKHFKDKRVGGVAGIVDIRNDDKLITQFQQVEYIYGQFFIRKAFAFFGIICVIPGPIGLFRKSAISEISGYRESKDVFAEDADLTIRLLINNWRVVGEDRMIATTEAPETLFKLLRQRYRWKRGTFQALHDNFKGLYSKPTLLKSLLSMILIFESVVIEVAGFCILVFFFTSLVAEFQIHLISFWLTIPITAELITYWIIYKNTNTLKKIIFIITKKITYSVILQIWGILSLLDETKSSKMSWDKLERINN